MPMVPCMRPDLGLSDVQRPLSQIPIIVGFDADTGIPWAVPVGALNGKALPASELFPGGWYVLQAQVVQVQQPPNGSQLRLG